MNLISNWALGVAVLVVEVQVLACNMIIGYLDLSGFDHYPPILVVTHPFPSSHPWHTPIDTDPKIQPLRNAWGYVSLGEVCGRRHGLIEPLAVSNL